MKTKQPKRLCVEISAEKVLRLLVQGQVCAADFYCLDCSSKQILWRLCLKSCAGRIPGAMKPQKASEDLYQPRSLCSNEGGRERNEI
jgi:hypothetical protein